jgi:hypothetical protein
MAHSEQPRRFSIGDALILIAGLAAGLALVRATSPEFTPGQLRDAFLSPRGGWTLWHAFGLTLELGVILFIPFVAGWTPACLLLQLTGPRPPWRRLRRRPGFVACLIATAFVIATLAVAAVLVVATEEEERRPARATCGPARVSSSRMDVLPAHWPIGVPPRRGAPEE